MRYSRWGRTASQDWQEERQHQGAFRHTCNEGKPCDVQFTSVATNDSFMLAPNYYQHEEIITMDRAYINYRKFEELTDKGVVFVTKMKKNLTYETLVDCMEMNTDGKMEYRDRWLCSAGMTSAISHVLSPTWTSRKTDSLNSYPC